MAIVTDRDRIHDAPKAIGWVIPGEVKVFGLAEREQATAWVSGA
jgi:hypothetical protein